MELKDLRYFCLTAELEHVTKAAAVFNVSQPFLSKTIKKLEQEVGAPLFDNVGRRIRLNRFGELFYEHAKKVLNEVDSLITAMDIALDRHEQTIKILCNMQHYAEDMIFEFQKINAEYALSVTYASRKEIIEALISGKADFALCTPAVFEEKAIASDVVLEEHGCVILPPNHRLLSKQFVNFDDLRGIPMVTSPPGAGMRHHIEGACRKHDYQPKIVCESNDTTLILNAVKSGLGFAIMPFSLLLKRPELCDCGVSLDIPEARGEIVLCYNQNRVLDENMKDFKGFIENFFKSYVNTISDSANK